MNKSIVNIPALRGVIGDWVYYVTLLPFSEIEKRVKKTDEVHSNQLLRDMIQRALTPRSKKIADYLRTQSQRFFNAIVLGVYDGDPQWNKLSLQKSALFDPSPLRENILESLGILTLNGEEKLFAIDGQHRVEGIKEYLKTLDESQKEKLEDEQCVILVAHNVDEAGKQRTRRLFATLNRYAKPVNLSEIIALDEDDVVAILSRRFVEEEKLFEDKISTKKGKSIPTSDEKNFTTISAFYQFLDLYWGMGKKTWVDYKRLRPSDDEIETLFQEAKKLWEEISKNCPPLREILENHVEKRIAKKYRSPEGGQLLFRPIGLILVIKVISLFLQSGENLPNAVSRVFKVPQEVSDSPWVGLLWDKTNQRMITRKENQRVATQVLFYCAGGNLEVLKSDIVKLTRELAGLTNREINEVELRTY